MCLNSSVLMQFRPRGVNVNRVARRPPWRRRVALAKGSFRPHFRPMQSYELLREVFQKCSPKQIAAELELSLSMIYKWAEPPNENGSGSANPLDRVEALLRCTDDTRIAQWVSERAGGFFVRNPKHHWPHPHQVIPATNQIVQEFADLLAVIATAAIDNSISKAESKSIRARWEELKSVTEGFVRHCEDGNFSAVKKELAAHEAG